MIHPTDLSFVQRTDVFPVFLLHFLSPATTTMTVPKAFQNLPPHVVRELKRHVSPKPLPKYNVLLKEMQEERKQRIRKILTGCVLFTTAAASIPLVAHYWLGGSLHEKEDGLTHSQNRRGAFLNSGSKDVGRDPNWDFKTGEYKKDAGYYAIFQNEGKKLPAEYLPMPEKDLKKHEEKIEAFARGEGKNNG